MDQDSALASEPAMSQACTSHTVTAQYFYPTPWTWKIRFHAKRQLLVYLWELIRLPFCLLRQAWIWTQVLPSLMSGAPKLVPEPFWVPLCNWNSPRQPAGRETPSPWVNTVQWHLAGDADKEVSLENKEGFPYIPFRAGYRNGRVELVLYMVTCYFIGSGLQVAFPNSVFSVSL
jgi:hypothetical protein